MTEITAHHEDAHHLHDDDHDHDHELDHGHDHDHEHIHEDDHDHEHAHGLFDILADALHLPGHHHEHATPDTALFENDLAIRTVKLALVILGVTTAIQIVIYLVSGSVALLGDTIHNLGDAMNSIPLWIAFALTKRPANKRYTYGYGRSEDVAGIVIVVSIALSAVYILLESIQKLLNPQPMQYLGWVALAAVVGFLGNEAVAILRMRVGKQIGSAALVADGLHARTDGLTSLAVLVAAGGTALGLPILDPIIGILMSFVILFITRDAAIAIWYRLLDAVDPQMVERAEKKILEHPEIKAIYSLRLRYVGHRLYGELLLAVDPHIDVIETEVATDHIRHELFHVLPGLADLTIGVVPWHPGGFHKESAHHQEPGPAQQEHKH